MAETANHKRVPRPLDDVAHRDLPNDLHRLGRRPPSVSRWSQQFFHDGLVESALGFLGQLCTARHRHPFGVFVVGIHRNPDHRLGDDRRLFVGGNICSRRHGQPDQ